MSDELGLPEYVKQLVESGKPLTGSQRVWIEKYAIPLLRPREIPQQFRRITLEDLLRDDDRQLSSEQRRRKASGIYDRSSRTLADEDYLAEGN